MTTLTLPADLIQEAVIREANRLHNDPDERERLGDHPAVQTTFKAYASLRDQAMKAGYQEGATTVTVQGNDGETLATWPVVL